jgi:tetratricopeptide (TPR) repeat protein
VRGSWREGVLERNDTEEGHELARRVGVFMERFLVPRGAGFVPKTAKIYAEHGAYDRASLMRAMALSNDHADVWALSHDFIRYFDDVKWPEPMKRTVYMNLLDRLASGGSVQQAEKLYEEVQKFAEAQDDRALTAWLLFTGSKIDARRQDFYRARDRANDALTLFRALGDKRRAGEVLNHVAGIELQDGNDETALKTVDLALQESIEEAPDGQKVVPPSVFSAAEQIRGLIARRRRQLDDAIKHFSQANDVAGRTGLSGIALDAGLSLGEAMLAAGKTQEARDVLQRVVQIARSLRAAARERSATELLAQAEGALRNFDAALQHAQRTLQLSQALNFEQLIPVDLYNLGFFHFAKDRHTEALTFFREAEKGVRNLGNHPVVKELYYFKGLAEFRTGDLGAAKNTLSHGLDAAQKANDLPKVISAHDHLGQIARQQGDANGARRHWNEAINLAGQANMKDARRNIKKKLEALDGGA